MKGDLPDLPPLWSTPSPVGHNGGPSLAPRLPGRPTIVTPELLDQLLDWLADGVPLRVICRTPGMPSRSTVRGWRRNDAAFNDRFVFYQTEGYIHLAEKVVEEVDQLCKKNDAPMAQRVFNLRRQQLSRMNPFYFGA
jgi:hypothetical protein